MAKAGLTLIGGKEFQQSLKTLAKKYPDRLARGLIRAGAFIQRESQKIVPVDTGALKGSAYTRKSGTGRDIAVRVGYQQSYAIYVHEMLENYHKPGKTARYLAIPLQTKQKEMVGFIEREIEAGAAQL